MSSLPGIIRSPGLQKPSNLGTIHIFWHAGPDLKFLELPLTDHLPMNYYNLISSSQKSKPVKNDNKGEDLGRLLVQFRKLRYHNFVLK